MYTQIYSKDSLGHEITKADKRANSALKSTIYLNGIVKQAASIAQTGFHGLTPKTHVLRGKHVYWIDEIQYDIVVRRLNRIIRKITSTKQSDRDTIVQRISSLLAEGMAHRAYKFDIQGFYESIDSMELLNVIRSDPRFSVQTTRICSAFLEFWAGEGVEGLPRGIALSATLAEYAMTNFDMLASKNREIYFYARYVDDIFILTSGKETQSLFQKKMSKLLFSGLKFNSKKLEVLDLPFNTAKKKPSEAGGIDFLGYAFRVSEIGKDEKDKRYRNVELDIAEKKVSRIKTRLVKSFLEYSKTRSFDDLIDRMKMLTGNYNIPDRRFSIKRNVGLYCNYRRIDPNLSQSLASVDKFLVSFVCGQCGNTSRLFSSRLTRSEKKQLLSFNFQAQFAAMSFHHFSVKRIHELQRCWVYG